MTDRHTDQWRTSSYSGQNGECVEVKFADRVGIRDTKNRDAGTLDVASLAWRAFLAEVR
ncbi:DUF397 domain-containing protein [Amycolatopsis antarctica]|uniref:DUF397 domain-containing protein n=1 Tax=Amycolatopsis antarctica TaxID=1854586 RepID=A0A263D9A6_9PSEU|nr:DUF397 domain-containing protein [Amycolatopsis antarctica]OZM73965.1 DUF397 domain-containing protein [Amycolatopsis antarctica]